MNTSDSERLEAALQGVGYSPASRPEEARFIVLNSCSVRASAEQRIIGKLNELAHLKRRHPDMRIVLWGCMVNANHESIFKAQLPMVDHFVGPSAVDQLIALAPNPIYQLDEPALPVRDWSTPPVVVYVPIQYGCNMQCSYCVIPLRRGREVSRPLQEVVHEAERLVERGAKEIILLGQIVDSWGHDVPGRPSLSDLLRALDTIPGLLRLRFLTSHPAWMTPQLIETIAQLEHFQHEINLPVQAGDNDMLRLMRRGYRIERYRELVGAIRATMPDVAMTTDVIVGHPGETRTRFEQTVTLLEEMRFDKVHIAAFSARPGTYAAELEQDAAYAVAEEEKQARRHTLEQLQERIATEINATLLGQHVEILVEEKVKGRWRGRTGSNKLVFFEHPDNQMGRLVQVRITWTGPWSLQGELV